MLSIHAFLYGTSYKLKEVKKYIKTFKYFIIIKNMDKAKKIINDFFEKKPTKDVYEKCLLELIILKNNIISNEEYDKNYIDNIDKVIESIQIYLSVASR